MISNLIGGFISILIGVSLIGPIATQVSSVTVPYGDLYNSSSWGASVLDLVPGFFALALLGVGIAVCYSSLREAGIV